MSKKLPMKLIATEWIPESTCCKYTFSIERVYDGCYKSPSFNVHNIVEICFMLNVNGNRHTYKISARKIILPKYVTVELTVRYYKNGEVTTILCKTEWAEWLDFRSSGQYIPYFEIWVNTTVNKLDSIIGELYMDEEFTDFQLSTAKGSVAVHKAQLAANSEVFKTMLRHEWKETTEGRIKIEGVTLQTLQHLKDYMYLGTLPDDDVLPLLQLSMCYMMDNLKAECLMKIAQTITAENLYDILAYSFINNIPEVTFTVLAAMPINIVEDARIINIENQKSRKNDQTDKTTEQEEIKEETNK